jgi:predicted nucleic acid-binding protein
VSFLCDTTVLFAASDTAHRNHQRSLELVGSATPTEAFVAAHSLAELYATLSATHSPRMRRLDDVLEAVRQAALVFTPVALAEADYLWVVEQVGTTWARSGQVSDALILKCAERANADVVYTWNIAHFRRIAWSTMIDRIRTP